MRTPLLVSAFLFVTALTSPLPARGQATVDVWVDPGHGGYDTGTPGFDSVRKEKNIALQVSANLFSQLANLGYSAYLTRLSDYDVPLEDRGAMASGDLANVNGDLGVCQLFVSMHMDARDNKPDQFGTTTYYQKTMDKNRRKDASLIGKGMADIIHPRLIANTAAAFLGCNKDLKVRPANYSVLRNSAVPSILIESGILTNQCQQNRIAQNGNQALVAQGIATGVSFAITPGGVSQAIKTRIASVSTQTSSEVVGERGIWPLKSAAVLAFSEGFEGATFPPPGWTLTTLGASVPHRWHRTTDTLYVHGGTAAALVGGESSSAMNEWLISPVTFLGPDDRSLRFFWSSNTLFAAEVNAECLVKRANQSTWTRLWQLSDEPAVAQWDWKERTISLSAFVADSIQFAFQVVGTNGADVNIDDVSIGNFPITAAPPNDACASATSLPAGNFTMSGTTFYSSNDSDPAAPDSTACSVDPLSSGDVFYSFNVLAGDTLSAQVNAEWGAVIYVVDGCDNSLANCLVASGQNEPMSPDGALLQHVFSSTGTYRLVVDGRVGEGGPFTLTGFLRGATTGVPDGGVSPKLHLVAGPNPAAGPILFSGTLPSGNFAPARLRIHDAAGRLIAAFEITPRIGSFSVRWDRSDRNGTTIRPGVYFATLSAGGESTGRTVVIRD